MAFKTFPILTANLDVGAHAIGDTLFIPVAVQALNKGFRGNSNRAILRSLSYAISAAIDVAPVIYFFSGLPTNIGAPNQPFNLQFADTSKLIGRLVGGTVLPVGAGRTWSFPVNNDVLNLPLRADNGSTIYVAGATTGAPTPGADCTSRVIATVEYLG